MIDKQETFLFLRATAVAAARGHRLAEDFTYNPRAGHYSCRCERCGRVVRVDVHQGRVYGPATRAECGEAA
jgi:hypothetical protein